MCVLYSQHPFPSLSSQALRKPEEGHQDRFLSPFIPVDSQSTRRASTSAIYGQASTRTAPNPRSICSPPSTCFLTFQVRMSSLSTISSSLLMVFHRNPLGRQRSVSDTHIRPPRQGHQKSASTTTQPVPAFSDRYFGHLLLASKNFTLWLTEYNTVLRISLVTLMAREVPLVWANLRGVRNMRQGVCFSPSSHPCQVSAAAYNMFSFFHSSSLDTSAETSSGLASYGTTPMSSASPFSAHVP